MSNDLAVLWRECGARQYELAERARLNQGTVSRRLAGKRRLSPAAEGRLRAALVAAAAERRQIESDLSLARSVREAIGA